MTNCSVNNTPKEISKILKILSSENRLKIVCFLNKESKCVCEITDFLGIPQNLASHHLKVLRDNNLLYFKKEGLKVIYSTNRDILKPLTEFLNKLL